jgi:hypothetical protein
LLRKALQLWYQTPLLCDERHGSALSPWDDEAGHALKLLFGADFYDLNARDLLQHGHVLPEGALQGQHANRDWLCYSHCCAVRRQLGPV